MCVYACVYVDQNQILLIGPYYFELTHNNLENNKFQV